jgi:hypothetical protein
MCVHFLEAVRLVFGLKERDDRISRFWPFAGEWTSSDDRFATRRPAHDLLRPNLLHLHHRTQTYSTLAVYRHSGFDFIQLPLRFVLIKSKQVSCKGVKLFVELCHTYRIDKFRSIASFNLADTSTSQPYVAELADGKPKLTVTSDNSGPYNVPIPMGSRCRSGTSTSRSTARVHVQPHQLRQDGTRREPVLERRRYGQIGLPFQVTNCAALKFEPKFTVSTSGKTSKANGASLTAKVAHPKVPQGTEADIAKGKVELPKQLPCARPRCRRHALAKSSSQPAGRPPASKIDYAVVHTPVLPVPLKSHKTERRSTSSR